MKTKHLALFAALPLLSFTGTAFAAVGNDVTGADSVNKTELEIKNEVNVDNDNYVDTNNDVDVHLSTGDNELKGNTSGGENGFFEPDSALSAVSPDLGRGSGMITTGDATADIRVGNVLNENTTCIGTSCEVSEANNVQEASGEVVPTEASNVSPAEGGVASVLPEAGANTPLAAIPLALGTLAILYLAKLRKSAVKVRI